MSAIADQVVDERRRLVATLEAVGPDSPTLAGQWTASDVASHLASQDRLAGIPAFFARRVVAATDLRLSAVYRDRPWAEVFVNGPKKPWVKALGVLSQPPPRAVLRDPVGVIALWEHYVHHEDVRRPSGIEREGAPDLDAVIEWIGAYNRRRLDRTVRIRSEDGAVRTIGRGPLLSLDASLADAVLWLSGRPAAGITSDAPADELDRLRLRLRG